MSNKNPAGTKGRNILQEEETARADTVVGVGGGNTTRKRGEG